MLLYKASMDGGYLNTKKVEEILDISLRQEYLKALPKGLKYVCSILNGNIK